MYIQSIYILLYVTLGGNFGRHQNASFCYQKVATRSRSASVHSDFSYDALRAQGEAVVTTQKIDIFLLVTTKLIAHSGPSECFRNCVGEFGMDTG